MNLLTYLLILLTILSSIVVVFFLLSKPDVNLSGSRFSDEKRLVLRDGSCHKGFLLCILFYVIVFLLVPLSWIYLFVMLRTLLSSSSLLRDRQCHCEEVLGG